MKIIFLLVVFLACLGTSRADAPTLRFSSDATALAASAQKTTPISVAKIIHPKMALPQRALALQRQGDAWMLGAKSVFRNFTDELEIEGGGAWRDVEMTPSTQVRQNAAGVQWTRTWRRDALDVWHLENRIEAPLKTQGAASWKYRWTVQAGEIKFARFSFHDVLGKFFEAKPALFNLGATTPFLVFEGEGGTRFAVRYSDPLDSSGTFEVFPENGSFMRWNIAMPTRALKSGTKIVFTTSFAAFPATPIDLSRRDFPRVGDLERSLMLAMGQPLPSQRKPKAGHFFTVRWSQLRDEELLKNLAAAGTRAVVIQSEDFWDIAQGVSAEGDYNAAPADIHRVLSRVHALGMKALWWFSIKGVLKSDANRNGGKASPLLAQHPEWFTEQTYWDGHYQSAQMFSRGWKNWVLEKLKRDLTRYPIDGFGFDEPYFIGSNALDADAVSYARNGYDFLGEIQRTIKSFGAEKMIIANYWAPVHDEWKFFDAMMTENSSLAFLNDVTGVHGAGHAGGQASGDAKLFTWSATFDQLVYNFGDFNQVLGWSHPEWFFEVRDGQKSPADIARLLNISGRGTRTWAGEIAPGVRQIEAQVRNEKGQVTPILMLANTGEKTADATFALRSIAAKNYRVAAFLDGASLTEKTSMTWDARVFPSLQMRALPPKTLLVLELH